MLSHCCSQYAFDTKKPSIYEDDGNLFDYNDEPGIIIENKMSAFKNEYNEECADTQNSAIYSICGCQSGYSLKEKHSKEGRNLKQNTVYIIFNGLDEHVIYELAFQWSNLEASLFEQ